MTPQNRRTLAIFFGALALIFAVIPGVVIAYDANLASSGVPTISRLMTAIGWEAPIVPFALGLLLGLFCALYVGLAVHFWAGMRSTPTNELIDKLQRLAADNARELNAADAEIDRLRAQLGQFIGKGA